MKVISGIYKGRKIEGFDITGTRPTMERVKESLFAMIQDNMQNSTILDLFSGSGNLAIESLSQGAKFAYLVDKNKKAIHTINKNTNNLGIKNIDILNLDFKKALYYYKENDIKFDIIFLDPPYKTDYIEKSIDLITKYNLLNKDGLIIAESSDRNKVIYNENYISIKSKKYGDKWVVILKQI